MVISDTQLGTVQVWAAPVNVNVWAPAQSTTSTEVLASVPASSPSSGVAVQVQVSPYWRSSPSTVSPGEVVDDQTILTISQIDPLRVDVVLPTGLFGSVVPGDRMEILPEEPLDEPRISTVAIVDRVLDGASGTFGARLVLPNPGHELPGGLRCQARLLRREDGEAAGGGRG